MGAEPPITIPIQLVGGLTSASPQAPCNADQLDLSAIGPNGISGILGLAAREDDSDYGEYFACQAGNCTVLSQAVVAGGFAVANPAWALPYDNNGVIIVMNQIPLVGTSNAGGSLFFGIGTNSQNAPAQVSLNNPYSVVASDSLGFDSYYYMPYPPEYGAPYFDYYLSFIDTGSNFVYYDDNIPTTALPCPYATGTLGGDFGCIFYYTNPTPIYSPTCGTGEPFGLFPPIPCPLSVSAALGPNMQGGDSYAYQQLVTFTVGPASWLLTNGNIAFNDVAGPAPNSLGSAGDVFDWGLPFFFGKAVFIAYGNTPFGAAPMWGFALDQSYNSISIQITTGNSGLQASSSAEALIDALPRLCLKPSSVSPTVFGPHNVVICPAKSGIGAWETNSAEIGGGGAIAISTVNNFNSMQISLVPHPYGADTWDIAGIRIDAKDQYGNDNVILSLGTYATLPIWGGSSCVVELKVGPGVAPALGTATFQLMTPALGGKVGSVLSGGSTTCGN